MKRAKRLRAAALCAVLMVTGVANARIQGRFGGRAPIRAGARLRT